METIDAVTGTIERAAKGAVSAMLTLCPSARLGPEHRIAGERSDIGDRGRAPAGYPGCARRCVDARRT